MEVIIDPTTFKLDLIAKHQKVSPVAKKISCADIPEVGKLELEHFMHKCAEFFSLTMDCLPSEEFDEYFEWSRDIMIYMSKDHSSGSLSAVGEVFGLSKEQVRAVQRRIQRTIDKGMKNHNYDLVLYLNALRQYIHD